MGNPDNPLIPFGAQTQFAPERRLVIEGNSIALGTGLLRVDAPPVIQSQFRVLHSQELKIGRDLSQQSSPGYLIPEQQTRQIGLWQIPLQDEQQNPVSLESIVKKDTHGLLKMLSRYTLTGLQQQRACVLVPVSEQNQNPLAYVQLSLEGKQDCVAFFIAEGKFPKNGKVVSGKYAHAMYLSERSQEERFVTLSSQADMNMEEILAHGGAEHRGIFHVLLLPIFPVSRERTTVNQLKNLFKETPFPPPSLLPDEFMGAMKSLGSDMTRQFSLGTSHSRIAEMVAEMSKTTANQTTQVDVVPDPTRRPVVFSYKAVAVHDERLPQLSSHIMGAFPDFS